MPHQASGTGPWLHPAFDAQRNTLGQSAVAIDGEGLQAAAVAAASRSAFAARFEMAETAETARAQTMSTPQQAAEGYPCIF